MNVFNADDYLKFRGLEAPMPPPDSDTITLFTDGSLSKPQWGAGVAWRLNGDGEWTGTTFGGMTDATSSNMPELKALLEALRIVAQTAPERTKRVVVCTDSQVVMQEVEALGDLRVARCYDWLIDPRYDNVLRAIWEELNLPEGASIAVVLEKVPAHRGVPGNEVADDLAGVARAEAEIDGALYAASSPDPVRMQWLNLRWGGR